MYGYLANMSVHIIWFYLARGFPPVSDENLLIQIGQALGGSFLGLLRLYGWIGDGVHYPN